MLQDYYLCQQWAQNRALQADAYLAVVESVALRPGIVTNTKSDAKDPFGAFHKKSPLRLGDLVVSQRCLDRGQGRRLPSGEVCLITCTIEVATNKRHRHQVQEFFAA